MPPQLMDRLKKTGAQVNAMTLGQKVVAVIGIGILLLGGSAFVKWASTPDYVPVYSGSSASDAAAINDLLTKAGIQTSLQDGSVMVPTADKEDANLKIAAAGLPKAATDSFASLQQQGITATQFQQKVAYQRAVEADLAKTIEGIEGVNTAVVHIAVPEETVFTDDKGTTTASVLVDTGSAQLTDDQVDTIIHLLSSSVPELAANQVTVSDASGHLLSSAGSGSTGARDQKTADYETKQASNIQKMLDTVLGSGKALASVNATLNFDAVQQTNTDYSSSGAPALSSNTQKEIYGNGASSDVGGSLGCNGVLGTTDCTGTSGASSSTSTPYSKTSEIVDNAVNKAVTQRVVAPGAVERQSVSVIVDQSALSAIGADNLQKAVATAAGFDEARGDVVTITPASFSTTAAKQAAADLKAAKAAEAKAAQISLIKQGGIALAVLVLLIIVLVAWRKAMKKAARQPVDLGALERMYPDGGLPPAPAMASIPGYPTHVDDSHLLTAPEPEPEALRRQEFGQLVDAQPTEVANLLRGWLAASKKG